MMLKASNVYSNNKTSTNARVTLLSMCLPVGRQGEGLGGEVMQELQRSVPAIHNPASQETLPGTKTINIYYQTYPALF